MSLDVIDTPLADLKVIQRHPRGDARGFLARLFDAGDLRACGWQRAVEQVNHTYTAQAGTIRGMHYQLPPHAEMKLVSCIRGAVWDVAVDLRASSPTFLQWHAERLSADNGRALLIPEGFAHGFQTLTDDAEMLYCHSAPYSPQAEAGLHFQDARVGIAWPLPLTLVSERDQQHPRLDTAFSGVAL
ncbi:dTDP-4-dehydrorhamnose 3,5-epimerase [Achromobacter spanius]|jgi:dTDP-4-dehydrorhamnose 3,5-epimerase|uniref:dTDP-4-dehydrorhamnose 3,5-epimerase n=1 Tax=Achromobacter spanius TaxID=217203 RepID=UPI000C2C8399|nr:dTDP-4-dehydrorhamnose 3,5-epimerase [Achromobacter spanius]AUA57519.1 dTDP-4-dehydrorhamnose 3,5-epimerase [Achromobacter spanius]CAB3628426.1 dTDP-4-dehydrorhamnose 3,5-epimerase [Achromobacter spanius]SPT37434.1 dTDP-4-dehydrorhamnose 3,5-epimerase [Achromobacter denitrificans]VEE54757.1 dTDP-4-dehydrorhamnose 3,5-epimerase [Achromobacter spanius]